MEEKKKKVGFNIIKNDSTDGHGGFGVGALSLNNVSPVIIDVDAKVATIEIGALHARSDVEKGIKFLKSKEEVPNGKPYWLVWVTIDRRLEGPYYAGVTACEMTVDREIRRGYKSLPEHVNNLDKSIKRKIMVEHMDDASKKVLGEFLKNHNEEIWRNSPTEIKALLGVN
jgi:hypothetical protein